MKVIFKATHALMDAVRHDLARPHEFAAERVGFISVLAASTRTALVLFAVDYYPVADQDYVDDNRVGALMSQEAIRKALEIALLKSVGMFHVHTHGHRGRPRFSKVDIREQQKFVPDFFKVNPKAPHGALVLSKDKFFGRVWTNASDTVLIKELITLGPRADIDLKVAESVEFRS